jgi:hypothetical protein
MSCHNRHNRWDCCDAPCCTCSPRGAVGAQKASKARVVPRFWLGSSIAIVVLSEIECILYTKSEEEALPRNLLFEEY